MSRKPKLVADYQAGDSPTAIIQNLPIMPAPALVDTGLIRSLHTVAPRQKAVIATRAVKGNPKLTKVWRLE